MALRQNPDLGVAALEIQAARARLHWAGQLPNPELQITASDDFPGEASGERSLEIGFTQRFPAVSALRSTRELRRQQLAIAKFEFASRARQTAFKADQTWIELAIASRSVGLHKDLLELGLGVATFLEKRETLGEASRIDVAQARLKNRLLTQQIADAQSRTRAAASRLRQLAGLPIDTLPTTEPATNPPPDSPIRSLDLQEILARRDDYQALLLGLPASVTRLALARARSREEISLSVFYEADRSIDEPEGAGTNHFAGLGISIPLPLRRNNGEEIATAEIGMARARGRQEALAYAIEGEVNAALETRLAAHRLALESSGELLSDARELLEETTRAHQSGLVSLLQVQQAQEQLLEIETGALRLLEAYLMADARVRLVTASYPVDLAPSQSSSPRPSQP
jgi:outer membrane protein TolC